MSRIKITMEADIGDLSGFWPNDPVGVTEQNVYSVLHAIKHLPLARLLENAASGDDNKMRVFVEKSLRGDLQLAERLLAGVRIEVT